MKNKTTLIVSSFLAFCLVVIIALSAVIYSTPTEVVSGTAGNFSANLCNGGYVVEDEGFLFFSYPNTKGIYRAETDDVTKVTKISEKGEGFLQVLGNTYYYIDENTIYQCDWEGKRVKELKSNVKNPLVVGSLLFYIDENENLIKYSLQNDTSVTVVSEKDVKEYAVYYKRIYYIDGEGNIRKVSFDGEKDELFITANAKKIAIDGHYIFYIQDGILTSAMLKDKEILKAQITEATEYAIYGSFIVYTDGKKTYYANVNKIISEEKYTPKGISESVSSGISIDDNYFYFFNEGTLKRIAHDGSNLIEIK